MVASCWLFLYDLYYDAQIHEHQTYYFIYNEGRWENSITSMIPDVRYCHNTCHVCVIIGLPEKTGLLTVNP